MTASQTAASDSGLLPAQLAVLAREQHRPGSTASCSARFLQLPGVEASDIAGAVTQAVAAYPSLAVVCDLTGEVPVAVTAPALAVRRIPATGHPQLLARLADECFDLFAGPLLRAVVFDGGLLLVASDLVADSDSLGVIMRDALAVLAGEPAFGSAVVPAESAESEDWWRAELAQPGGVLSLPYDADPQQTTSPAGRRFVRRLDPALVAAADALADRLGAGRATVYLGAYAALLRQLSLSDSVVVHVPTRRPDMHDAVGPWTPLLPMRIEVADDPTFAELVARVRSAQSRVEDYADVRLDRLPGLAPAGRLDANACPAVLFEDADDGLPGEPVFAGRATARADLELVVLPAGLGWAHRAVVGDAAAAALAARFECLLAAGLVRPDLPAHAATIIEAPGGGGRL